MHGCDYKGYGRSQIEAGSGSDSVPCYVPSWDDLVDEMIHFIKNVKSRCVLVYVCMCEYVCMYGRFG